MFPNPEIHIEDKIKNLDSLVEKIEDDVDLAVQSFKSSGEYRLFVAERIYKLGTLAIKPLKELFNSLDDDKDLQYTIAILLLKLGDTTHIDTVIKALNNPDNDDICLIAHTLAKIDSIDVSDALIQKLLSTDSLDQILCLIKAVNHLTSEVKVRLLNKVKPRLTEVDVNNFNTVAILIEILSILDHSLDESEIKVLSQNDINKRILKLFEYI